MIVLDPLCGVGAACKADPPADTAGEAAVLHHDQWWAGGTARGWAGWGRNCS